MRWGCADSGTYRRGYISSSLFTMGVSAKLKLVATWVPIFPLRADHRQHELSCFVGHYNDEIIVKSGFITKKQECLSQDLFRGIFSSPTS